MRGGVNIMNNVLVIGKKILLSTNTNILEGILIKYCSKYFILLNFTLLWLLHIFFLIRLKPMSINYEMGWLQILLYNVVIAIDFQLQEDPGAN